MTEPSVVYVVLALDDPFSDAHDVVVDSVWTDPDAAARQAESVRGWVEKYELR